jgi:hypothetical protein
VFIQPGAADAELLEACRGKGLRVHEGCVLLEI